MCLWDIIKMNKPPEKPSMRIDIYTQETWVDLILGVNYISYRVGNLKITGRLKELIVTAGGENVAPVLIENEIIKALPIISNCMVIGDLKKYLAVILTFKLALDKNGKYYH